MSESTGSVKSPLHFESFKVDTLNLKVKPHLDVLRIQGDAHGHTWFYNINIRTPMFFKSKNEYVGGINFGMMFLEDGQEVKEENSLITLSASIVGIFKVTEKLSEEIEQNLVKVNIPVILMPNLRAAVISLFACSGYGTVIVPVINIAKMAQDKFKDSKVQIVE